MNINLLKAKIKKRKIKNIFSHILIYKIIESKNKLIEIKKYNKNKRKKNNKKYKIKIVKLEKIVY